MVSTGDVITNPISGETFTFLQTAADTGGKLLQFDTRIRVGGGMAASLAHVHPLQEERLYIKSGCLRARINGSEKVYGAGEMVVIPAGLAHEWCNDSVNEELHFVNELEPALQWEDLFTTVFAAARTGIASIKGEYPLLRMAVVLNKYRDHFYLANTPVRLQKMLFALLAPVGKLLGYKEDYRYR
jgi:mannose-6-phosphate isomerase-like protein (cupin superfamily)